MSYSFNKNFSLKNIALKKDKIKCLDPLTKPKPNPFTNELIWVEFHFFSLRKIDSNLSNVIGLNHEFDQIQSKPTYLHI